jgi:hypothetical protein
VGIIAFLRGDKSSRQSFKAMEKNSIVCGRHFIYRNYFSTKGEVF